jgi:hypothetical protein
MSFKAVYGSEMYRFINLNELMLMTSRWLIVKYLVQNVSLKSHEFDAPILGPTL